MGIIDSAKLIRIIEQEKRFMGLCVNCLFSNDEFGEVVAPVFQTEFPVHLLTFLLGADFDIMICDPIGPTDSPFRVLPLQNQNGLLQAMLFAKLLHTHKHTMRKIPWAPKQKEKDEKLRSKKEHLENLFSQDIEDTPSSEK
tara:strand:- start:195 stop:617 length:423 start_codon:yes stop_codon:yes gene_type:complete